MSDLKINKVTILRNTNGDSRDVRMSLRERIGHWILLLHIQDSYWIPSETDPHVGTGYFKIDYNWYRFVKWLSGCKPEELIKKGTKN